VGPEQGQQSSGKVPWWLSPGRVRESEGPWGQLRWCRELKELESARPCSPEARWRKQGYISCLKYGAPEEV